MVIAWHGEPTLKRAAMERLREHRRLDDMVQGTYWVGGRGCHLGCLTHADHNTHQLAARLFGIEQRIGYWLEAVFEGLPKTECGDWVLQSTDAMPVGADLSKCHHHFGAWLLGESGLLTIKDFNRDAIDNVRRLHQAVIDGERVTQNMWSAAWSRADSAAASSAARSARSARSAARSAAESARSAAESARSAAESAWSAAESARSAAAASAWSAAWRSIAAKSIEIFASAPVVQSPAIPLDVEAELCGRRLWCRETESVL